MTNPIQPAANPNPAPNPQPAPAPAQSAAYQAPQAAAMSTPPIPPVPAPPQQPVAQVPFRQPVPTGEAPQAPVPPQSGAPQAAHTSQQKPFSALAITALVFAIIAALLSWVPIVNNIAFFIAIIGLVFAGFAMHVTRKAGPRRGKALAVAALVVLLVAGGLVLGTQTLYGKAIDTMISSSETTTTSKPKKSKAKTEKKAAPAVQDMEGDVDGANYHVKLDSLTKTVNDYEGKPTVMLTYEMTNNKSENSNPMDLNVQVFQNGHQLDTAIYSDQAPEGYDVDSESRALQPSATGTITLGYVLEDETSPVTVEASGTFDMSGQKVTHEFALQ